MDSLDQCMTSGEIAKSVNKKEEKMKSVKQMK